MSDVEQKALCELCGEPLCESDELEMESWLCIVCVLLGPPKFEEEYDDE